MPYKTCKSGSPQISMENEAPRRVFRYIYFKKLNRTSITKLVVVNLPLLSHETDVSRPALNNASGIHFHEVLSTKRGQARSKSTPPESGMTPFSQFARPNSRGRREQNNRERRCVQSQLLKIPASQSGETACIEPERQTTRRLLKHTQSLHSSKPAQLLVLN